MTMTKSECGSGVRQVLDHVEHHNDVHHPQRGKVALVRHSSQDVQSTLAAIAGWCFRNFDAGNIVRTRSFFQEKTISAADLKEAPTCLVSPYKLERVRKPTAQYSFCALIVSIAVSTSAREIIAVVVVTWSKLFALSSPKPTGGTLHNRAIVLQIQELMRCRAIASGAVKLHGHTLRHGGNFTTRTYCLRNWTPRRNSAQNPQAVGSQSGGRTGADIDIFNLPSSHAADCSCEGLRAPRRI